MTENSFTRLPLIPALLSNLESLKYQQMTAIQAQSLPPILQGRDVIGQGKTGSGKTAAFGLGLLNKLNADLLEVQAMVICPTRELADQVCEEIRRLARGIPNIRVLTLCGGVPNRIQTASLERGAHIIVGTPGRIEEHCRNERLHLSELNTLVLDEADRMLEMGFEPQINAILEYLPGNLNDGPSGQRQTLLFSATFPDSIAAAAQRILVEPVTVKVESTHDESTIEQHFYQTNADADKLKALRLLLQHYSPNSAIVFCNTKVATQQVTGVLKQHGFSAAMLNGDLEQKERDITLIRFANGSVHTLVATDVAARGLDIQQLDAVINYDVAHDPEVHTHRIGRTGRAGSSGLALTLFNDRERRKLPGDTHDISAEPLPPESASRKPIPKPEMITLRIDSGKKQKIRPGDILGALTKDGGLPGSAIGKINVGPIRSYVAIERGQARQAADALNRGKLKGRTCRASLIGG